MGRKMPARVRSCGWNTGRSEGKVRVKRTTVWGKVDPSNFAASFFGPSQPNLRNPKKPALSNQSSPQAAKKLGAFRAGYLIQLSELDIFRVVVVALAVLGRRRTQLSPDRCQLQSGRILLRDERFLPTGSRTWGPYAAHVSCRQLLLVYGTGAVE